MIVAGVSMAFFVVGAGLVLVGVVAFWRQSRAANCPRHSRLAGGVAITLACVCVLAGIGLLAFAVGRQDTNRLFSAVVTGFKNWIGIKEPPPHKPPALPQAEAEQVVDRLIGMGYLKFVPESKRPDVRRQLIESAGKRYLDADWDDECVAADLRGYPADNEDLAEGQVGATILLMKPVLEKEGVKLDSVVDEFGDEKYEVVINGKSHLICEGDGGKDSSTVALKRLLEITNGLLEAAGSPERLFSIYGGNDGRVMLLTEEMQDYIESIGDVMDYKWMPRRVEQIKVGGQK
jgi:hypothetical protein